MRAGDLAGKVAEDGNLAFFGICMRGTHQTRSLSERGHDWWLRNSRRSQASTSRFTTPSTILQRTDNEKMVLTDPLSAHQGPLPTLLIRPLAYSEEAKPLLVVCFWGNSGETPGLKPIIHLRSHYDLLSSTVVHSIMHILPTEPLDLVNFLKSMITANLL
jgi:hypothetical protein